ncbi:MAG: L-glutamate gamma-semialdehyde dehydrogenase [Planctomycetaceae bacterium]|nr:L-glutamate gamma-semialdehyde dehydrogenase [Planctomycetaceae bacterium]
MSQEERPKSIDLPRFENEPHTDFSRGEARDDMKQALQNVRDQFGIDVPLVINGKAVDTRAHLTSRNPSRKLETLGTVASANADQAAQAIDAAHRAFAQWRKVSVSHRAEYIELIAAEMRNRRFELAAWMVFECGKPWKEADADVAEAIDFCVYYAMCMRELQKTLEMNYPGEQNSYFYRPRGVTAVIAPWNFPLAILTGMTVAALATGNTVVMKPAEQASIIASKLMDIGRDAGLPHGVLNFLPGTGEDVGQALVRHRDVKIIAFTGSQKVGLMINRQAAQTEENQLAVKKVIAEMGGKNAIIVDEDADLDDAVSGVLKSAFGYAGQKCSACSRVIVMNPIYDTFVERFAAACESLRIGPAEDPGIDFGPVIDEEAFKRINDYLAVGNEECEPLVAGDAGSLAKEGYFIGPHVFTNVEQDSRIAQDEIFGPVLAVMKARDLDDAFLLANRTRYALTGGFYSRSPKNLHRAREEFFVGNLYLNRNITGALVQRQPFGGYRMSGIGTKAGGPDYLLQYLLPVTVTENTMRRGFAPNSDEED